MKQKFLLCIMMIGTLLSLTAAERPNIVWLFSDDHAYQALGAYGDRFATLNPTPNLDKLAQQGMVFEKAYVGNSICAPSRATLLTGKHSHKHGKVDNIIAFDHNQQQFQKILQKNGYQTCMIGKIHLEGKMQGFDYWEVLPGQGEYWDPKFVTENGMNQYKGCHSTEVVTERALNWLDNGRDTDGPFMLMVHYKAPHRKWEPMPSWQKHYESVTFPEPDNLFDNYEGRGIAAKKQDMTIEKTMRMLEDLKVKPGSRRFNEIQEKNLKGKDLVHWKYQTYMRDYMACVSGVDEQIGKIMDYLKEHGLENNTVVMYSSDQGFFLGEHGWFDKRFMYEESFRTPFLACWPGVIKPGSRNKDLVQNIDFAETFLDIAGIKAPDCMQGESLMPLFKGKTPKNWRTHLYYHYYMYPGGHNVLRHEGVTDGRFKLIRFYGMGVSDGEEWEFYDLKHDPSEMRSKYNDPEYSQQITFLRQKLDELRNYYEVTEQSQLDARSDKLKR